MKTNREKIKEELINLAKEGENILNKELANRKENKEYSMLPKDRTAYQSWYTNSLLVVKQLIPERYEEFQEHYKLRNRQILNELTYSVSDYVLGYGFQSPIFFSAFCARFIQQIAILKSTTGRIDSILADIQGVLEAELFDNGLDAATDLMKKNHLRSAGVLAGVVLETHLSKVISNHSLGIQKKEPTISDFNDDLKKNNIYDVPTWRLIQRLADIRNLCCHAKEREPKPEEVEDLINGVKKIIKEVF